MKLDRNKGRGDRGKYAIIKLRSVPDISPDAVKVTGATFHPEVIDFGDTPDTEFFVIRLKAKFAGPALVAYAEAIHRECRRLEIEEHDCSSVAAASEYRAKRRDLEQYRDQIVTLAAKAEGHPQKRIPS